VASSQEFSKPAPQNGRGFFCFLNRTAAARHGATSLKRNLPERRKRAAVRALTPSSSAGAREVDGHDDEIADTLADLHRLTFFESAPTPQFD
jgi:hypothetical protein